MTAFRIFVICLIGLAVPACICTYALMDDYAPPMQFEHSDRQLVLRGVISTDTPMLLREQLNQHPQIDTLVLINIPGSEDDEANLSMAEFIHRSGLNTLVPADGMIASGGTDLFLAGKTRTIESGACIGVHSWADSFGESGDELPKEHRLHELYLDYFNAIEIPPEFYWFTLAAADADNMYWMSNKEMNKFNMTSVPLDLRSFENNEQRHSRCDAIPNIE